MNPPFVIQVELSPAARAFIENFDEELSYKIPLAMERGLNKALPLVVERITEERLSGEGPFPVSEHRLGVVSGQLRQSVRSTSAVIEGDTVTASIGSPLRYAAVHEFGFHGYVEVKAFFRHNRHADRSVKEPRVSMKTGKSYKARVKTASGLTPVRSHKRHMKIPARSPFGYGVADSEQLIANSITAELVNLALSYG